jgi:hypothetical protein
MSVGQGVFTPELRFKWVKGFVGTDPEDGSVECGDGTIYPLEVTLDQLAEIMYRVKFAEFTSSTFKPDLPYVGHGVATGPNTPRVQHAVGSGAFSENYRMSGYWCLDSTNIEVEMGVYEDFEPSDYALNFLGEAYTSDVYADFTASWFGYPESLTFRDISENERGLWVPHVEGKFSNWNNQGAMESLGYTYAIMAYTPGLSGYDLDQFKTAFTWYSRSHAGALDDPPPLNIPWISDLSYPGDVIYEQLEVCVQFNGNVAVVGDIENIHHPDNRFFVGMHVSGSMASDFYAFSTAIDFFGTDTLISSPATYKMVLSASSITIPIYRRYSDLNEPTGELEHSATEWWPYAKDNPAVPVWDTATGAKL